MSAKYDTMIVTRKMLFYIEKYGFVAKSRERIDNPATVRVIETNYHNINMIDKVKYYEFIRWVKNKKFNGGFEAAKDYCLSEQVTSDKLPFICAVVSMYFDNIKRQDDNKKFMNSEFQSEEGKREKFFLKLYNVRKHDALGGIYYVHHLHDRDYNVFTFIKPSPMEGLNINECAVIRATVKKHFTKAYDNFTVKETQLNRPKILWNVGKKENENE